MTTPWTHPKTGVYWYRKVVPDRARHLFGGKREVRRSLRTKDRAEARVRYVDRLSLADLRKHYPELDGQRLVDVGAILDIPVLDHIIVGERRNLSFSSSKLMPRANLPKKSRRLIPKLMLVQFISID